MVARMLWEHLVRVRISASRKLIFSTGVGGFSLGSNPSTPTNLNIAFFRRAGKKRSEAKSRTKLRFGAGEEQKAQQNKVLH